MPTQSMQPKGASSQFNVSERGRRISNVGRIEEHRDPGGCEHHLTQQSKPLRGYLGLEEIDACRIAARPGEASDKAQLDRVFGHAEGNGNRWVAALAASAATAPPGAAITLTCRR